MKSWFGFGKQVELSVISCGDAGAEMGVAVIKLLRKLGKDIKKSLLIQSGNIERPSDKVFRRMVRIPTQGEGFAKDLEAARKNISRIREELTKQLGNVIPSREGILLITTGAGATGVAATLMVSEILKNNYQISPPIFFLLPEVFENSRIQFNAAELLYNITYRKNAIGNPVIFVDNKTRMSEFEQDFSSVVQGRMDFVSTAIANLLFSAFARPANEEYNTSIRDLTDVLFQPGIGAIISSRLRNEDGDLNLRFDDIMLDMVSEVTDLSRDAIAEARKVYVAIFDVEMQPFQFKVEAKKIKNLFNDFSPYLIFLNTPSETEKEPSLNALITGLPLSPRIIQLMQIARDSRKKILLKEIDLSKDYIDFSPEAVEQLEAKLRERISG